MKIGFGSDKAGNGLKRYLLEYLSEKGHECIDLTEGSAEESPDYPLAGILVAEAIRRREAEKGILVCGTGAGVSIAANKVPGIRAAACSDCYTARMLTEHNQCQIIALGQRVVGIELAKMIVDSFLEARPLGGRHAARVDMICRIEEEYASKLYKNH